MIRQIVIVARTQTARSAAIVVTGDVPPAGTHGLTTLKHTLRKKGLDIADSAITTADSDVRQH